MQFSYMPNRAKKTTTTTLKQKTYRVTAIFITSLLLASGAATATFAGLNPDVQTSIFPLSLTQRKILPAALPQEDPTPDPSVGTVYVAFTIDTEPRNPSTTVYSQNLDLRDYQPGGTVDQLMQSTFRSTYRDSTGHPVVFSWFQLAQELQCASTAHDCSVINAQMQPFQQRAQALGDLYGWHYHHADWTDLDNDGVHYWNQLQTFNGTTYGDGTDIQVAERIVAQLIYEKGTYPGPFRTGWTWENNDMSNWLDDITPFDFSSISPLNSSPGTPPPTKDGTSTSVVEPLFNVFDWTYAPTQWTYYHPSATNYQIPGNLKRYVFRSANDETEWDRAFTNAAAGQDQLVVVYAHSYNTMSLFQSYLNGIQQVAANHPGVPFRYVTANDGARKMIFNKNFDTQAPTSTVTQLGNLITVAVSEPLFTFPYGALYINGDYQRVRPTQVAPIVSNGTYSWTYDLSSFAAAADHFGFRIGGVDPSGNTFTTDAVQF